MSVSMVAINLATILQFSSSESSLSVAPEKSSKMKRTFRYMSDFGDLIFTYQEGVLYVLA